MKKLRIITEREKREDTPLNAKILDGLHHRGSCNSYRKASLYATRNLLKEY